jgi:hypothetical protein
VGVDRLVVAYQAGAIDELRTRRCRGKIRHHPLFFEVEVALDPAYYGFADRATVAQSVDGAPLSFEHCVDDVAVVDQFLLCGRASV